VCLCAAAQVLLRDKMNILLLLLPLALVSHGIKWPAGVTFVLALLPLCSLAEVSSSCTVHAERSTKPQPADADSLT
jgi:hypothetical protein